MHRAPARPRVSLGYVAGFDGLRALGLVVMLAYHHGIDAARGGIFTVSMFFTLSGFLIATLALQEWSGKGTLSLARFWERRARRLLPAAFVTVAGVVVLQYFWNVGSGPRFRGDILSALGYVANWRMAYSGADYGAIFQIESPVQHFWSLAVEEQFYVAFPILFAGLMALTKGRWRIVGVAFALGAAASFVAAWIVASRHGNSGLAYYAAYTRASEILVGVAVAFAVVTRPAERFLTSSVGVRVTRIGGVVGLIGLLWLWTNVSLESKWVFHGGTAVNAGLTCLVILACISSTPGLLAKSIGIWPLRSLGRISYAVYLFHWPLFLFLDEERTGLSSRPLFLLRVGVTIALAVVSYHLVESPFRFRLKMPQLRLAGLMTAGATATVVVALLVPVRRSNIIELVDFGDTDTRAQTVVVPKAAGGEAAGDGETAVPTPPPRMLLVGDSVAWTMAPGLGNWNTNHPDQQIQVDTFVSMGCTLAEPGITHFLGKDYEVWPDCKTYRDQLALTLAQEDYDAIVVVMGNKDLGEREIEGAWRAFGDPVYDQWFHGQAASFADILAAEGVPVLWATLTHTQVVPRDSQADWREFSNNQPERVDRINEIVAEVIEDRAGFHVLDIADWMSTVPDGELNREYRADTVHWTFTGSDAVAEFTVPELLAVVSAST